MPKPCLEHVEGGGSRRASPETLAGGERKPRKPGRMQMSYRSESDGQSAWIGGSHSGVLLGRQFQNVPPLLLLVCGEIFPLDRVHCNGK